MLHRNASVAYNADKMLLLWCGVCSRCLARRLGRALPTREAGRIRADGKLGFHLARELGALAAARRFAGGATGGSGAAAAGGWAGGGPMSMAAPTLLPLSLSASPSC